MTEWNRDAAREKNRIKNENRKRAKQKSFTAAHKTAGKELRRAFGGAFGRAPDNVKYMAAQGTTMEITEKLKHAKGKSTKSEYMEGELNE